MSKLLIFGAGASRNYTQATHGIMDLKVPLDLDFFSMAKKVILSDPLNFSPPMTFSLDHLLEDLWELFRNKSLPSDTLNAKYSANKDLEILDDKRLSLEYLISMFYEYNVFDDSNYELLPGVGKNRLRTLLELLVYTLSVAQRGPICGKHFKIANSLQKGDTIISFNYDTILDDALRKAAKLRDSGYNVDFSKVLPGTRWAMPDPQSSPVMLLKLHGSLNWWRCKRCKLNFLIRKQINLKTRSDVWNHLHPKCIRCGIESVETVIIPPLIGKNYHEFGLDYHWSDAYNIINRQRKRIQEVIVIGYSLPKADVASTLLFRKLNNSITSANSKVKLTIVNPDMRMIDHFKEVFSTTNVSYYNTMDRFISSVG